MMFSGVEEARLTRTTVVTRLTWFAKPDTVFFVSRRKRETSKKPTATSKVVRVVAAWLG